MPGIIKLLLSNFDFTLGDAYSAVPVIESLEY